MNYNIKFAHFDVLQNGSFQILGGRHYIIYLSQIGKLIRFQVLK